MEVPIWHLHLMRSNKLVFHIELFNPVATFSSQGSTDNQPLTENCKWFFVFTPERRQVLSSRLNLNNWGGTGTRKP